MHRCQKNVVDPWLHRQDLANCVQDVVEKADWAQIDPAELPFHKSDRNVMFLGILTYCYALGIYPTRDIMRDLVRQKGGSALALAGINSSCLQRFRRGFKLLLVQCLADVLQTVAQNMENRRHSRWAEPARALRPDLFAAEAQRRVELAVEWDGASA